MVTADTVTHCCDSRWLSIRSILCLLTVIIATAAQAQVAPTINSFVASPSVINSGGSSTLSWSTSNAATVTLNDGATTLVVNPSGSIVVSPPATTTFQLKATNPSGSATGTVTVTVSSPPTIISFTASPSSVSSGQQSMLSWTTANATGVVIDNGIGARPPNGSVLVSPLITTNYMLSATGPGGGVIAILTVTVTSSCTLDCAANVPAVAQVGASVAFSGTATSSSGCLTPTYIWTFGDVSSGSSSQNPQHVYQNAGTYEWTLTVNGGSTACARSGRITIGTTSSTITDTSFIASPTKIRLGQTVTLSWVTAGATSVFIDNGVGTRSAAGSVTVSPTMSTTYTLSAMEGGTTIKSTVTIEVLTTAVVNVTSLPQAMVQVPGNSGATARFDLTNSGATATTITLTQTGTFFTQSPLSITLEPGATQTVTISVLAQPAGAYEGASILSGVGVPSGLQIPVKLLSALPPSGTVSARSLAPRVDVAAPSGSSPSGSASFKNTGNSVLTGILASDVPWIIPQGGVVTIAPGDTASFTFAIDRAKRPDAAAPIGSVQGALALSFQTGRTSPSAKRALATPPVPASVSLVMVVDTALLPVANGSIPSLAFGEVALFVAGAGHVLGSNGAQFVSDVNVLNSQGGRSIDDLKFYYMPAGESALAAKITSLPSVPAQVSVQVADVVKSIFSGSNEVGTLQIRSKDATKLVVAATVLTTSNPAGSFGNTIPVFRSDRAIGAGSAIVLTGLRKDATTHTNFYIQETSGAGASVQTDFLASDGSTISSRIDSINAFKLLQLVNVVPANSVTATITNTSTAGGKIAAYATPVDEASGDTWAVADWSRQLGYAGTEASIIPVAGTVHGVNGTFYRTDLSITNRGTTAASGTLRYVSRTGEKIDRPISLGGKQSDVIADVIGTRFGMTEESIGFLMFTPVTGSFAITSRTYTTVRGKPDTFGTGVPTLAAASALQAGGSRLIAGFADSTGNAVVAALPGTVRTNFGLMETMGKSTIVRVTFRFTFPAGAKVQAVGSAARDYALSGYQFLLLNSIAGQILGPSRLQLGDLTNVEADFQVISGDGAVLVFTSSLDNSTGDSILRIE